MQIYGTIESIVMNAKYSFCFGPFGMPSVNGIHSLPAA